MDVAGEWRRAWGNLPCVAIGILRLSEIQQHYDTTTTAVDARLEHAALLYWLYTLGGLASALHHVTVPAWTVVLDWAPLALSLTVAWPLDVWQHASTVTWFKAGLAVTALTNDPPWRHALWHMLTALALDGAYQDYLKK